MNAYVASPRNSADLEDLRSVGQNPTMPASPDEVEVEERPTGYEALARFMGTYPELAIFRRFGALNLTSIIFMQTELAALEREYDKIRIYEKHSLNSIFSGDWYRLVREAETAGYSGGDGPEFERYHLMQRIRTTLEKYSMYLAISLRENCCAAGGKKKN